MYLPELCFGDMVPEDGLDLAGDMEEVGSSYVGGDLVLQRPALLRGCRGDKNKIMRCSWYLLVLTLLLAVLLFIPWKWDFSYNRIPCVDLIPHSNR